MIDWKNWLFFLKLFTPAHLLPPPESDGPAQWGAGALPCGGPGPAGAGGKSYLGLFFSSEL